MKRIVLGLALALLIASPGQATMTVGEFLVKANALKAKGMMALFSSDLRLLKRESADATAALRAEKQARTVAGRPQPYCVPSGTKMGANQMITDLNAIPPAERGMTLKDGFARVLSKRYPCR